MDKYGLGGEKENDTGFTKEWDEDQHESAEGSFSFVPLSLFSCKSKSDRNILLEICKGFYMFLLFC